MDVTKISISLITREWNHNLPSIRFSKTTAYYNMIETSIHVPHAHHREVGSILCSMTTVNNVLTLIENIWNVLESKSDLHSLRNTHSRI